MTQIKDFLYLDTDLVNSIFSQYYKGIITSLNNGVSDKESTKANLGFDFKLVKGSIGASDGTENSQRKTIDLHHYAYEMLEEQLVKDGVIDGTNNDIVMLSGMLRIVDAVKTIENFDGLKTLISGFDAAMKLSPNQQTTNAIPQDLRSAVLKSKDISKLLGQLSDNGIFAYIGGERVALNKDFLVSKNSPEFANNGKLFDGKYILVGLKSNLSIIDDVVDDSDMLLGLSKAMSAIQDIMKLSNIKPIAIYRIVDER